MPDFYRQLAADPAGGAVLDLPHGLSQHAHNASAYMYYQTIHHHPIAWSYLSRSPLRHPNAGLDGLWAAEAPAGPLLRARLRALGYRYVVVHRDQSIFLDGSVAEGRPGAAWSAPTAAASDERLIKEAFGGEAPVHVDDLVTVWAL